MAKGGTALTALFYDGTVATKCREMTKYDAGERFTISIRFKNGTFYDENSAFNNELIARAETSDTTWSATVTGEVGPGPRSNKWFNTWAECRGVWGRVGTSDGTFTLPDVPLYAGTNELVVTVTDVSGNQSTETRKVFKSLTNCLEVFHYDGNGNLTNWVNGAQNWVYQWDWADRLTKVTSNGVVVLENWYDAGNRRIAKKEVVGGQTKYTLYILDGWASVAVLNQSAQVLETFTRGVGLAGDIGTLAAVTHHAGSSTNGTFYTHHNHRGDITLTRAGTATVGRYNYSAFGTLDSALGADVCRFKFSSKERDVSTEWSYYGYRFYAPQWQRWPNRDPLGEEGGINLYAYVDNNPVNLFDSLGLSASPTPCEKKPRNCWKDPSKFLKYPPLGGAATWKAACVTAKTSCDTCCATEAAIDQSFDLQACEQNCNAKWGACTQGKTSPQKPDPPITEKPPVPPRPNVPPRPKQ